MALRGVRGATTVEDNEADEILAATRELLQALAQANGIAPADVASIIFTATPDLTPAALLDASEHVSSRGDAIVDDLWLADYQEVRAEPNLKIVARVVAQRDTNRPQYVESSCSQTTICSSS